MIRPFLCKPSVCLSLYWGWQEVNGRSLRTVSCLPGIYSPVKGAGRSSFIKQKTQREWSNLLVPLRLKNGDDCVSHGTGRDSSGEETSRQQSTGHTGLLPCAPVTVTFKDERRVLERALCCGTLAPCSLCLQSCGRSRCFSTLGCNTGYNSGVTSRSSPIPHAHT